MKSAWFGEAKDPLGVPANTPPNVTSIDLREPDLTGSHIAPTPEERPYKLAREPFQRMEKATWVMMEEGAVIPRAQLLC